MSNKLQRVLSFGRENSIVHPHIFRFLSLFMYFLDERVISCLCCVQNIQNTVKS